MVGELKISAPASTADSQLARTLGELFAEAIEQQQAGRMERAIELYRLLVSQFPSYAPAWNNLGVALRATNRFAAAASVLRRGTALDPNDAGALSNLGNALRATGDYEEAAAAHEASLAIDPDVGRVHYNLALVRRDLGDLEAALAGFSAAEARGFKSSEMFWDRALTLLVSGELEQGFSEYEWRWQLPDSPPRFPEIEVWDGKPYDGKTLLVHTEQGFGDAIQFLRYLPRAAALGGRLVYECPPPLSRLVKESGVAADIEFVEHGAPVPAADLQISLLSLARIFGTTLDTIPWDGPYLSPPSDGPRLQVQSDGLRVGLVWAGKPTHKNNRNRSIQLETLLPLLELPNMRFVGLQKGDGADQPVQLGAEALVINIGERMRDFADTAAVLKQLDLVVSVDTSIVHLAGALGVPAWALIPFSPDWRWLYGRDDTPWYPSVRLFRQTSPRAWPEVVAMVRDALAALGAEAAQGGD